MFKKIEYYLTLRELDSQFTIQLDLLSKEPPERRKHYPTWEIEKKILFWSYIYHKFLGHSIKAKHLTEKDMFISGLERDKISVGVVFENLEAKGLGNRTDDGFLLNGQGRDFGNLLWYLYDIKKYRQTEIDVYKKVYGANYCLRKNFFGFTVLIMQLVALILLMLFGASFVVLEILDAVNLLDNLVTIFKWGYLYYPQAYIILIVSPIILLTFSIITHFIYKVFLDKKYKWLEEEKSKIKDNL